MKKMIKLFDLPELFESEFVSRPNRFVANIKYKGEMTTAHVHDPGRLKELLLPGVKLLMVPGKVTSKHPWYIKAVQNNDDKNGWILLDSAFQPKIARKLFGIIDEFKNFNEIKSEVSVGKSRIDFTLDGIFLECKGVSLVNQDSIALFPDAPTKRGARHVEEIIRLNGMILFIIFKKAKHFSPNVEMDPIFSEKLIKAYNIGIKIICAQVFFDGKTVFYDGLIPKIF